MECVRLTPPFCQRTYAVSHTFTPTPEQTHSCSQKYTPMPKPQRWYLLLQLQEWVELMWNALTLGWLWNRHSAVPTCALQWSTSTISSLCQSLNLLQGILGISATQQLLLPFLPALLTHNPHFVYTKTWGLDTLHSQRRKKTKMRYR